MLGSEAHGKEELRDSVPPKEGKEPNLTQQRKSDAHGTRFQYSGGERRKEVGRRGLKKKKEKGRKGKTGEGKGEIK